MGEDDGGGGGGGGSGSPIECGERRPGAREESPNPPTPARPRRRRNPLLRSALLAALLCSAFAAVLGASLLLPGASEATAALQWTHAESFLPVGVGIGGGGGGAAAIDDDDADAGCPFRRSSLYRSVYVYPAYNDTSSGWNATSSVLSDKGRSGALEPWPWLSVDAETRRDGKGHYDVLGQMGQYTLELIVRDIFAHPHSCLRTYDPEAASLFYVPYLPSAEFHRGRVFVADYSTSPYAAAVYDAIEGNYREWEDLFGLTSRYWRRRGGSDHVLVFSEPLHGLSHPRSKRGNHHYIYTQRQLRPPIVISVELSATFVSMYPKCAAKNVLAPYPNPDGRWYNGKLDREAMEIRGKKWGKGGGGGAEASEAALPAEKAVAAAAIAASAGGNATATTTRGGDDPIYDDPRPLAHYYSAGPHGTCANLRRALAADLGCSPSARARGGRRERLSSSYALGMRASTFCPCPGGDSPGAKRMFDALLAGCVPVILSEDFVWPFTREADRVDDAAELPLDPAEFSLRWRASDFAQRRYDDKCRRRKDAPDGGVQEALERLSHEEITRLRGGVRRAAYMYRYYRRDGDGNETMPDNPLKEGILPEGGAAHELVRQLERRAKGWRWGACEEELRGVPRGRSEPTRFKC